MGSHVGKTNFSPYHINMSVGQLYQQEYRVAISHAYANELIEKDKEPKNEMTDMKALKRAEKRILLSSPTMHGEEMGYIQEAFDRNWIAPLGFNVDGFEDEMTSYLSKGQFEFHALALSSGTAALHLAVKLAGVKPGDVVLCSDMTFAATVNPVSYEGGKQVFIDSEYDTWNMDPVALEKAFQWYDGRDTAHPKAKVVIAAHLYGTPSKIDEIKSICNQYDAILIEDAAESLGATYKGRETGTFGKYNAISFNGNKIITTSGGGMLLTVEQKAVSKALFWATQAREKAPWYQHEEIGYNYRMSNVVAGIGRGQLKHLEEHRDKKQAIYERYKAGLSDLPVKMNPYQADIAVPNFWLSCLTIEPEAIDADNNTPMALNTYLNSLNIESRPIWKPMHLQPVFAGNDFCTAEIGKKQCSSEVWTDRSVGLDVFNRGICLPSDIKMSEEEQDFVIEAVRAFIEA